MDDRGATSQDPSNHVFVAGHAFPLTLMRQVEEKPARDQVPGNEVAGSSGVDFARISK